MTVFHHRSFSYKSNAIKHFSTEHILRQNKQSLGPFKKRMKFDRNFLLVKQPKMRKMKSEKKGQTDPMNVDNSINTPILFYFILLFF
jgi:hypothetical protein